MLQSRFLRHINTSFNAVCENKILTKISEFSVNESISDVCICVQRRFESVCTSALSAQSLTFPFYGMAALGNHKSQEVCLEILVRKPSRSNRNIFQVRFSRFNMKYVDDKKTLQGLTLGPYPRRMFWIRPWSLLYIHMSSCKNL